MKRLALSLLLSFCLLPLIAASQDDAMKFILAQNQANPSFSSGFKQTTDDPALHKTTEMMGSLYFQSERLMAMHYSKPTVHKFIINNNRLYMNPTGAAKTYNLDKVRLMSSLADLLCNSMMGRVADIAKQTGSDIDFSSDKETYTFVFTRAKKSTQGYKRVELRYSRRDGHLTYMQLTENSGKTNTYRMLSYKPCKVSADKFAIPTK